MALRKTSSAASKTAAIAALIGALAGCKAVGPDFQPPAPPTDSGYLMRGDVPSPVTQLTTETAPTGAWWKALGSATLDRTMDEALAGNRTLVQANASLERVRQQAISVRGAQAPQVDANAGLESQRVNVAALGFPNFPNPTVFLYSIGATVTYDFDVFGGLRRASEAANAREQQESERTNAAYLTLTGQTAMAALQIAAARGQIEAVSTALADDQRLIDMVEKAAALGGQPRSAADAFKSQLASDESLLPPLRQQLAQARHTLAMLVGETPQAWTAPDFDLADFTPPATIPVSLPSELVRRRPDILAAEAELHAATAQIGVETAKLYPDIRLSASLTQTTLTPAQIFTYNSTGWTLAGGLTQPFFHGGSLKANQRAAEADARAMLAGYQQTVLNAFVQVADVMQAIANDDATLAALDRTEASYVLTLNDAETAFRLGGGPLFPVIDAQRHVSLARLEKARVAAKRLSDIAELFVATASDWREGPAG
jgi:NodT family efflux transporter outer membrane factor (OMF) lipoprotein